MAFVPGVELSEGFHRDVVAPLLAGRRYSAGRLGWGSDVLGYDDERSTDHGWGPQLLVLVGADEVEAARAAIESGLPETYGGWPVVFGWDEVPATHHVVVTTLSAWLVDRLGIDASAGLSTIDWLLLPQQRLLEVTSGGVFRDDDGALGRVRSALSWYPEDVWRWLLACQWLRLADEEAFVGRADDVGDERGARLVAARQVRELIRLWFLCSRRYAPYAKWRGRAFAELPGARAFGALLDAVLAAGSAADRDRSLADAYEAAARRFAELGLVADVDPTVRPFHSRPYSVLLAERFTDALVATLPAELARLPLVGAIDQLTDATDLLEDPARSGRSLRSVYEG